MLKNKEIFVKPTIFTRVYKKHLQINKMNNPIKKLSNV